MDLVLIVSLNGLEKQEVVKTIVGKRTRQDSEPVRLDEVIDWYSEFSSGCPGFNRINYSSLIGAEADSNTRWASQVWGKSSYGISYHVVTPEEARKLIETKGGYQLEDDSLGDD
jgi:hypothetical protein